MDISFSFNQFLIFILLINEFFVSLYIYLSKKSFSGPKVGKSFIITIISPFLYHLELPAFMIILSISGQIVGITIQIISQYLLWKNKSFGVDSNSATVVVSTGVYQYIDHPIYIGIIVQLVFWTLWMPLGIFSIFCLYQGFRFSIQQEYRHLLSISPSLKLSPFDNWFWNLTTSI